MKFHLPTGSCQKLVQKDLQNSYIKAIKWAELRLRGKHGVIAFVCPSSYLNGKAMDGMRQVLHETFSKIYIIDLKGDQYTKGEESKSKGKIFGSGSRTPISILIMIKIKNQRCRIRFYTML